MRSTMRILSRTVLIAALGIIFSFAIKTEVKAYTLTVNCVPSNVDGVNAISPQKNDYAEGESVSVLFDDLINMYDYVDYDITGGYDYYYSRSTKAIGVKFNSDVTITLYYQGIIKKNIYIDKDQNVASVSADPQTAGHRETVTLTATVTNPEYEFDQWTTNSEGVTFADASSSTTTFEMPNHYVNVYAESKLKPTYSITFDANGGTVNPSSGTTGRNGKLASLPEPGWADHDFIGWFTAQNGGTQVSTDTVFTGNDTIYAHWKHRITFYPNGGNFNGSTTAVTRTTGTDGKLTSFPQVQYDGHTLVGWFDDATDPNTAVELDKVYSGDTILTAHWTETPSNPVCTGASINAPSQLVKGQSYNIPFIFTFNRDLTDADHQFISDNAAVRYSVNYKSGTSEDIYRNNTFTWMYPISIPLDATGSLTLQIVFEGEDQDTKTIPIVDPSPTTHTVTYKVVNGKWNDDTTNDQTEDVTDNGHPARIPAVGSKPNANYKAGSWSPSTPNTTTSITGDVTYTYTYAQDEPTPPAPTTHTVTFRVVHGKWNDGSTGDKTETVADNGHLASISAVGNEPDANYKAGSWSPSTPNTSTAITSDKEYTYTYVPESATIYTVTTSDDGHGSAEVSPTSGITGTRVTITATPDRDYQFKEWRVIRGGVDLDNRRRSQTTFNIGNANVEVKAIFEKKDRKKDDDDDDDDHHEDSFSPAPAKPVNPNAIISSSFTMTGGMSGIEKIGPQVQGPAAQAVFNANTPAGWKEAFSFNMTANDKADYTLKKGILSFKIPSQYLKAGRKFAILGIDKNGKVKMFPNIDTKDDTITVNIDIEGYAFDLIYFD